MSKRILSLLVLATLLLPVSCTKEDGTEGNLPEGQREIQGEDTVSPVDDSEGDVVVRFSATVETGVDTQSPESRTTRDENGKVEWVAGDEIRIWWSDSESATTSASSGGISTEFEDVSVGQSSVYFAAYRASDPVVNISSETFAISIPEVQSGLFQDANVMIGRTLPGGTSLYFYYASTIVKFNISRTDISSLTLRSSDGSAISGSVTADFSEVTSSQDIPSFSVTDGSDEIEIPINGPGTYYAAILPGKAIADGLLFRCSTESDYLPAVASGKNQASYRGKVKNYTVSGGLDSKIVTDFYVTASGSGSMNGKSPADAFDEESFRNFISSRSPDGEASRSQAFRLYGTTFHVSGNVQVAEPVSVSFSEGAYEKNIRFTIDGGVLSGGNANRILTVSDLASVSLGNLTLSAGNAGNEMGGALSVVSPTASVEASDCTFSGNNALEGGAVYVGSGSFAATDCTFSGNSATVAYNYRGGGALKLGGASAVAEMHRCTFTSNMAEGGGGAVCCAAGAFHAAKCTFSGNISGKFGGALNAEGGNAAIFLSKCKLSGNSSGSWGSSVAVGDNASFAANGSVFYGNSCSGSNDAGLFLKGNTLLTGNTIIEDVSDRAVLHMAGTASSRLANNIIIGMDEADMAVYMDGTTHAVYSYGGNFIGRIAGASLQACQAFIKDISDIYNWKYKEFKGAAWNSETSVFSWTNGSVDGYYPAKQAAVNTALSIFGGGFSSWATDIDA